MELIVAHPKDNALVVKHNYLIEGRYDLTLQEKRLILWLISEIKIDDKALRSYRVSIKELAEFVGIEHNKKIYSQMEDVTKRLMQRVVSVRSENGKVLELFHWVSYARYDEGSGYAEFRLSDELAPYLLELKKNFTKLSLRYAISLKSAHAIRIYEILKQYETIGERTITISEIREYCGIKPEQYKLYADIRIYVITIAQREINSKTDIRFDYEEIKTGRKVTAVRFFISKNDRQTIDEVADDPTLARLLSRMIGNGLQEAQAREYLMTYPVELVTWAIEELGRRAKKGDKIDNPAGWLIKAIEEDWRPQQRTIFDAEREQHENARKTEAEASKKGKERISEIEPIVKKIRNGYGTYVNGAICSLIDTMKKDDRIDLERSFEAFLKQQKGGSFIASKFNGGGGRAWIEDALVRQHGMKYLSDHCPDFMIMERTTYAKRHGVENFEELEREYMELTK